MPVYIALLRGINVGGNKKVPMKTLVALCESLGYESVSSYIQSGNLVFRSEENAEMIANKLYEGIEKEFGFTVDMTVRSLEEWREILAKNPFPVEDGKKLHVFLLVKSPEQAALDALKPLAENGEELVLLGQSLYFHTPNGFGNSKLAGMIERKLKISMTARNWNTMQKLLEMAESLN